MAKTILGHSKVETTQVYAEKDVKMAIGEAIGYLKGLSTPWTPELVKQVVLDGLDAFASLTYPDLTERIRDEHHRALNRLSPPGPNSSRLVFEDATLTVVLDQVRFSGLHPTPFHLFKAIHASGGRPVSSRTLLGLPGMQGKNIVRELGKLPAPLRSVIKSKDSPLWLRNQTEKSIPAASGFRPAGPPRWRRHGRPAISSWPNGPGSATSSGPTPGVATPPWRTAARSAKGGTARPTRSGSPSPGRL
jgi:hypothetical protein